jgi:putative transposase
MRRTYKFRVYPTTQQKTTFTQWLTICRLLYNNALAERRNQWQTHQQSVSYYEQANHLKTAKKDQSVFNKKRRFACVEQYAKLSNAIIESI